MQGGIVIILGFYRRVIEELSTSGELELSDDSTGESDSEQVEQKPLKYAGIFYLLCGGSYSNLQKNNRKR